MSLESNLISQSQLLTNQLLLQKCIWKSIVYVSSIFFIQKSLNKILHLSPTADFLKSIYGKMAAIGYPGNVCNNWKQTKSKIDLLSVVGPWTLCFESRRHSVSLDTNPPQQTTTQQFLLSPQAPKILASPPWNTKSSDNSNTLNMFNNSAYTNFKTAFKRMLILR